MERHQSNDTMALNSLTSVGTAALLVAVLAPPSVAHAAPKSKLPNVANAKPPTAKPSQSAPTQALDPDLPKPCASEVACKPGDQDGDGIRDSWEDTLALRYAPEVRLAPQAKDRFRPANVEWYLDRVHMRFENKGACNLDVQVLGVGKVTQANMANQTRREKNMTFLGCKQNGKKHFSNASKRFFLQPPNDDVHKGSLNTVDWKVYVHVKESEGNASRLDIQYWFFYPYNDSFGSANHEADWEHITVTTKRDGTFVQAHFAQHEEGKTYAWNELTKVNQTHIVVYSADGSHASYNKKGSFGIPGAPALKDHTYDGGPKWNTWTSLVHVGEKDRPRNGQSFLQYGGRWGEIGVSQTGPLKHTSGPQGPAFQDAWEGR